jgi:hydrogenase expression/formation protein HypC
MSCGPHDACITCSDQAVPMVVERLDAAAALATCVDGDGGRAEVDVTLVDAAVGETVLVHAGTAIA